MTASQTIPVIFSVETVLVSFDVASPSFLLYMYLYPRLESFSKGNRPLSGQKCVMKGDTSSSLSLPEYV